jgi:hypothetical protein
MVRRLRTIEATGFAFQPIRVARSDSASNAVISFKNRNFLLYAKKRRALVQNWVQLIARGNTGFLAVLILTLAGGLIASLNEYGSEITYDLDLLGAVEEEWRELDGERVAAGVEKLWKEAARGDMQAQAALVRVSLLLDRGRERRRRVDELRRGLRVWNQDAGAIGRAIERNCLLLRQCRWHMAFKLLV